MLRAWLTSLAIVLSWAANADGPKGLRYAIQPKAIAPHTFFVQGLPGVASAENQGFNSNAAFVVTSEGVVVIDVLGTPALGQALLSAIRHVTQKPVKRVILTHYHADHFYGLQAFKDAGAEIWAHRAALDYLDGEEAPRRLAQRAGDLAPWVDAKMPLVRADRWLDKDETFTLGGIRFDVAYMGPAHSPEDLIVSVPSEGVVISGDILYGGRIPFVGEADSKRWLATTERLLALKPKVLVPGHGAISTNPGKDLALTREYLTYLRQVMGKAVEDFTPFDEAYAKADWSRYAKVPAFDAANRINAYGQYLVMERELLEKK
ncbi:MBL fold metallo-hydrolase [Betaproteobacteria bacterium GR16-43]|nr:MBL fold metallo-hydrolase [Betaproteobacteria bacterium GR16-43]